MQDARANKLKKYFYFVKRHSVTINLLDRPLKKMALIKAITVKNVRKNMSELSGKNSTLVGVAYMLVAIFTFSVINLIVKDTTPHYPIIQVVFFRNFFAIFPCAFLVIRAGGRPALKTTHWGRHLLCGSLGVLGLFCLFKSFYILPLADATAFTFSSILFVTAFSTFMLKEAINFSRWIAVLVGFLGILIMANPTGDVINVGALFAVTFALIDAFVMLNARILTRTDHPAAIVFYFAIIASVASGIFLPFIWVTPSNIDLFKLIFLGIGGGVAQIFLTHAYGYAPARVVAPMIYSAMVWGVLFGFLFWGEVPPLTLWAGCALLVGTGIFIIHQEHKQTPSPKPENTEAT